MHLVTGVLLHRIQITGERLFGNAPQHTLKQFGRERRRFADLRAILFHINRITRIDSRVIVIVPGDPIEGHQIAPLKVIPGAQLQLQL